MTDEVMGSTLCTGILSEVSYWWQRECYVIDCTTCGKKFDNFKNLYVYVVCRDGGHFFISTVSHHNFFMLDPGRVK